jgi:hypothetical protein
VGEASFEAAADFGKPRKPLSDTLRDLADLTPKKRTVGQRSKPVGKGFDEVSEVIEEKSEDEGVGWRW